MARVRFRVERVKEPIAPGILGLENAWQGLNSATPTPASTTLHLILCSAYYEYYSFFPYFFFSLLSLNPASAQVFFGWSLVRCSQPSGQPCQACALPVAFMSLYSSANLVPPFLEAFAIAPCLHFSARHHCASHKSLFIHRITVCYFCLYKMMVVPHTDKQK